LTSLPSWLCRIQVRAYGYVYVATLDNASVYQARERLPLLGTQAHYDSVFNELSVKSNHDSPDFRHPVPSASSARGEPALEGYFSVPLRSPAACAARVAEWSDGKPS